jgi:hypothetical protein
MNALALVFALVALPQTQAPPANKVDVVAVAGCLKEASADVWVLTGATDPVASNANAPSAKELAEFPKSGKNEYQLIGVAVFDLPKHRGHAVLLKGLLNKATPMSRLNLTSLTMVSAECPAK